MGKSPGRKRASLAIENPYRLPQLIVTESHGKPARNHTRQTSISRTDNGISLSNKSEDGQSYRIQSSQDLKQWRDEEIIKGDGEKNQCKGRLTNLRNFLEWLRSKG